MRATSIGYRSHVRHEAAGSEVPTQNTSRKIRACCTPKTTAIFVTSLVSNEPTRRLPPQSACDSAPAREHWKPVHGATAGLHTLLADFVVAASVQPTTMNASRFDHDPATAVR